MIKAVLGQTNAGARARPRAWSGQKETQGGDRNGLNKAVGELAAGASHISRERTLPFG